MNFKPGVVVHTFDPSTSEGQISVSSRSPGQLGLPCPKKDEKRKNGVLNFIKLTTHSLNTTILLPDNQNEGPNALLFLTDSNNW